MKEPNTKRKVMQTVAAYFGWCFQVAQNGLPPKTGFYCEPWPAGTYRQLLAASGAPLLGGFRGCFAGFKADLKARKESHFFNRSYTSLKCCDTCSATQPFPSAVANPISRSLLYSDFSPHARWRGTNEDNSEYLRKCADPSPWHVVPGFHKDLLLYDLMHVGPLGIWRDIVAALLIDMITRGELPGISPKVALNKFWVSFRNWCRQSGMSPPQGHLSMAYLGRSKRTTDYPELASVIKAATVKSLMCFVAVKLAELPCDSDYLRPM